MTEATKWDYILSCNDETANLEEDRKVRVSCKTNKNAPALPLGFPVVHLPQRVATVSEYQGKKLLLLS